MKFATKPMVNVYFFSSSSSSFTNISFQFYYFVCAIGGQHDGHLPFWLLSFEKLIMLLLHVLFAC